MKNLLTEVGDSGAKVYDFTIESNSDYFSKYFFETDLNTKYKVYFNNSKIDNPINDNNWTFTFGNLAKGGTNFNDTINKGEFYKVMATVMKILDDFIKKHKNNIDSIIYKGTDERRDRIYQKYISQSFGSNFSEAKDEDGNVVLIPKFKKKLSMIEGKKIINKIISEYKKNK